MKLTFLLFFLLVIFPNKLIILSLIVLNNLYLIWRYSIHYRVHNIQFALWALYLIAATFSTIYSSSPPLSLLGHHQLQDGLLFWILIFCLFTTNQSIYNCDYLAINNLRDTHFIYFQHMGIFIGVYCNSIYTIFNHHGYFSHPGHSAIFICLYLTAFPNLKLSRLATLAILFTSNRISLICRIFLLPRKYWILSILPLLLITKHISTIPPVEQFFSGRSYRYYLAEVAFWIRPLYGWGFDSFHHAAYYLGYDLSFKVHNFFLDLFLQLGIFGALAYLILLIFTLSSLPHKYFKFVACYFICIYFWYDCAEITWFFWWYLSLHCKLPNEDYL